MAQKTRLATLCGRPILCGAFAALAGLAFAVPVVAEEVKSGNDNVTLAISGQINRAVLYADDGKKDRFFHVDNDNSSTRIRFIGKGQVSEDFSAGTQIEVQFESNSTAAIKMDQKGAQGPNNFTERKLEFYMDSKKFGRVWIGQGDTASNGTSEVDLSGTAVVGYSGIADFAGGLEFGGTGGRQINQAWSQFDGFSRDDRIRYDTPTFAGLKGSVSAFEQGDTGWDAALWYLNEFPSLRVAAAVAYGKHDTREQLNGSISLLHESGVNATFASGKRDGDEEATPRNDDPFFWYAKLGYRFNTFDFGRTALAVDFGQADDVAADDEDFQTWGIFLVQKVDAIATEFYAGFRNHSLDQPGADPDDINSVMMGARVKF